MKKSNIHQDNNNIMKNMKIMIKYKTNLNNILNLNSKSLKLFILKFIIKLLHKFMN